MALTLYIGNKRYSSWSMRPWVLLKALDIPFDENLNLFQAGMRQPQFDAFSPSSKVPCLHDAANSTVVWDSLAIVEYIAEQRPGAWPEERAARAFARCAAAEMHSGFAALRNECGMNVGLRVDMGGTLSEGLARDLSRLSRLFDEGLSRFGGPWLAGRDFSAVDAFFAPVASRCKTYGLKLDGAAAADYVDRLFEHPAVQAWVREGIAETAREPMHEEESTQGGRKVLQDLSK